MARESITSSANTGVAKRRAATSYGRRLHESQALAAHEIDEGIVVFETTFPFNSRPDFVLGDKLYNYIPVGAKVLEADLIINQTWLGGTALSVGTYNYDTGAVINATGLVTATEGAVANLVAGNFVVGAGTVVGALAGAAVKTGIKVNATGTFTAGEATLRITVQLPVDRFSVLNG